MNITSLKSQIISILHGTTSSQIQNFDALINRAARQILLDCDLQETKRYTPITNGVFNSVYDYSVPSDLKGNKIIDLAPQVNRGLSEVWGQLYNQNFDLIKSYTTQNGFTIVFNNATKSIRINSPTLLAPTVVNTTNTIAGNGTWAVTSSASNLLQDDINYQAYGSSLSFDLAASGSSGYIENSTMTAVDLSDMEDQGTFFLWAYLPDGSDFTSVALRVGSSSTAYWTMTATTNQAGSAFEDGWNLLSFAWSGATQTLSPDASVIDYARITFAYNGDAQTAVRVNNLFASLATIINMEYYSKYLFRDASTGAFVENITADTNLINLDTDSFNLLVFKTAEYAAQQQQGVNASAYDGPYFADLYKQTLQRYQSLYKSELQKNQSTYYSMPNRGRGRRVRWGY